MYNPHKTLNKNRLIIDYADIDQIQKICSLDNWKYV